MKSKMSELQITKIEAWACDVPLDTSIDFGAFCISSRKHTVLRLTTKDGIQADVIGQSRGAPIDVAIVDVIAPIVVGRSAHAATEIYQDVVRSLLAIEMDGLLGRAWSLVELAIEVLQSIAHNVPLWQWLGGSSRDLDVLLVEGYAIAGEPEAAFVDRIAARVDEGFSKFKIEAAHYPDDKALMSIIDKCSMVLPEHGQLVLDFVWSWHDVKSKKGLLQALEAYPIAWIEDSFHRTHVSAYQTLTALTSVPVGCGDEATRQQDLIDLLVNDAVDLIRMDGTTIGGISGMRPIIELAKRRKKIVSFHEHPETHEHIALGLDCADHVEVFPNDRPFDCVHKIAEFDLHERLEAGRLKPSTQAGNGVKLRIGEIEKYCLRYGAHNP